MFRGLHYAVILGLTLWAALIVLAVYEWKWLVVGCLVALAFLFRGMAGHKVASPPLANHKRKEDDAQ